MLFRQSHAPAVGSDEWIAERWRHQAMPGGYEARCQLDLPADGITGARVLDVGCRRGKGCYKLSEAVGESGFVVGIDGDIRHVRAAREGMEKALARSGLPRPNLAFEVGYPEMLRPVAEQYGPFDYVFVNSVINLSPAPPRFYYACHDALRPGGALIMDTFVTPWVYREGADIEGLNLGNVIQAAPSQRMLEGYLRDAHFASWSVELLEPVHPSAGRDAEHEMPYCPDDPCLNEIRRAKVVAIASESGRSRGDARAQGSC